jgi:plasmid stabilization system protein ParE
MRKVYETIRSLRQAPYRGRPGTEQGTREILFPPLPYVAVYRVNDLQNTVEVLRVYHGAQDCP